MILTDEEYKEFLKVHLDLLYFVGQQKRVFPTTTTFKKFVGTDLEIKFKCREFLAEDENLLDQYIASRIDHLQEEQLMILIGFKKKVKSNFVILKCLTKHAIFIDTNENKFYAVKALGDPFTMFFDQFPVNVSAILIPFKDKIIYDGFLQSSGIYYGRNITIDMNEEYKEAKRNKKILTKLDE